MRNLTFNISETSKITGISIDTLRYYDKINLIQSKKNPQNNYRYYTISDLSIINHIKKLRDLDLSINEIKLLLSSDTQAQRDILQNHHKVLLQKISTIVKIEKIFKDTLKQANSTDLLINVPVIKYHKKRYFKEQIKSSSTQETYLSKKGLLNNSNDFSDILDKFVFPFYNQEFNCKHIFNFFEFGKIDEDIQYYTEITDESLKDESNVLSIPECSYIETITKLSLDTFDDYFINLINWIDYKNLVPLYPGIIKYLDTSMYFMNENEFLIKFEIPFKHKEVYDF